MFKLPKLQGTKCPTESKYVIYFSCDYDYFDRHGFALQQSINRTLSWMHVHCHIINEGNINHTTLKHLSEKFRFTYTWEDVTDKFYVDLPKRTSKMKEGMDIFKTKDVNYIARRTYLASVRFMRLPELFPNDTQHILQIDCDTILRNGFHKTDFENITTMPSVMPKPKDPSVFIASAISLGKGNHGTIFKNRFSQEMIKGFQAGCYWFIDQDILRSTVGTLGKENIGIGKIGYKWNAWGIKKDDIFSTGKGDKKENRKFKLAQFNWLPAHWKEKVKRELVGD